VKHGTRSRYNAGCRCVGCTAANRAYNEQRRRAAGVIPLAVRFPLSPHGTTNRYVKYRCRCNECKAANTEAVRRQRAKKKAA
jgi:hypothetical protein